jgi:hypothetical protein
MRITPKELDDLVSGCVWGFVLFLVGCPAVLIGFALLFKVLGIT